MATDREHHIPAWDGTSRTWRRYTREVCWYVRATPVEKRRYCATKLLTRLTGPARLLAMSWTSHDFDHVHGTRDLLRMLAESPLVRQNLPNAAAICQQYFSFKRGHHEAMNSFLVREALGFSEFVEAILMLMEDRMGVRQHEKNFGLPEEDPQDWWWSQDAWGYADPEEEERAAEERHSPTETERRAGDAGDGSGASPMRLRTPSRRSVGVPGTNSEVPPGFELTSEDLSLSDSFVLGVLRGFRLLQSAGLSADEKRDILSATKGSLDFEQVSRALQTLWDEQFLGRAHQAQPAALGANYIQEELYYQDAAGSEWPEQEAYWTNQGHGDEWDDQTWWPDPYEAQTHEQEETATGHDDPEFLEAQKSEQEAEALAIQAQRTWTEAQKATQALRRDRGFGHVQPSKGGSGCFICGGPHGYRDCPDKNHPSNFRGKGKSHYGFMADYDPYELYYTKGKGKSGMKGKKGKNLHVMESFAMWKGKGKTKSKPSRPAVNAYASETFYGLEIQPTLDLHATSTASLKPGCSLIDCGATASAGPEESVKGLISSILAVDKGASVSIAKYMRPFFRFGNGKWGQANYKVSITSNVSGSPRSFHMYCLPNPDGVNQPGFNKNSLVPVLLGMDHLSGKDAPESAMTVDFATGLALDSNNPKPDIYQLQSNSKGHYVRDIVYYLTQGFSNPHGTPSITVREGEIQSAELQTLEFHPIEFYDISISERELDDECRRRSEQKLLALHAASHGNSPATRSAANLASMHQSKHVTFNSTVSASPSSHGSGTTSTTSTGHCGLHQGVHSSKGTIKAFGSHPDHGHECQRSKDESGTMAVLRQPCGNEATLQCTWGVGPMCSVQSSTSIHPQEGQSEQFNQVGEPSHGGKDASRTSAADAWMSSNISDLPGNAEEDRCRGSLDACHRQGGVGATQGTTCISQGKHSTNDEPYFPEEPYDNTAKDSTKESPILGHGVIHLGGTSTPDQRPGESPHCGGEGEADPIDSPKKAGRARRKSGKGIRSRGDLKDEEIYYKPLTHGLAAKVMLFASVMLASATSLMSSFSLDDRDGLWEMACAPHSWLSDAASRQGLNPRRINLEAGFDLYKKETWDYLRDLRRKHRPRRLWISLPCTKWCKWTSLNYSSPERQALLESYRRRERRMLWMMYWFLAEALEEDPELLLYWEWPFPCEGWNQRPLLALQTLLLKHGMDLHQCRLDGCAYGLRSSSGELMLKKWMIKTNDEHFHQQFRAKVCTKNHHHCPIEGAETSKSAYYPWKLCESLARFWASQTTSTRSLRLMQHADVPHLDFLEDAFPVEQGESTSPTTRTSTTAVDLPPSTQERDRWSVRLQHFHRAAGHCSTRNLARIVKEANLESWKVKMAMDFKCPTCESLKPGGVSSGNIPPSATHAQFGPWEAVGMDVGEWTIPGKTTKLKFLLMVDMATRLRVVYPLMEPFPLTTIKHENSEMIIKALSHGWLANYPKPRIIVADNAKTFTSLQLGDFCRESGLELSFPAEKEPWAHGLVEKAIKDLKHTASAIQIDNQVQDPSVTLVLAASALNSTEHVSGYTPHQWAFGRDYTISEEDYRTFAQLNSRASFATLTAARLKAEQIANKTRSQRILVRLGNSRVRQPLRDFKVADLVMVWRQVLPQQVHQGPRGGHKRASKPSWIGPGRVILTELLPHQEADDHRRHIVWVLMHGKLLRCSVHSVRPVTPTEQLHHDINYKEDPTRWKSLADLMPRREYEDITTEVPAENETEMPHLPSQPDGSTVIPARRAHSKTTFRPEDWKTIHRSTPLGLGGSSSSTSGLGFGPALGLGAPSSGSTGLDPHTGLDLPPSPLPGDLPMSQPVNDYEPSSQPHPEEPDPKRPRNLDYDLTWVEQLSVDAQHESTFMDVYSALMDCEEVLTIEFSLHVESHRQRKMLERNPVLYMTKKMNSSEVRMERLSSIEKELFARAKMKEVDSFLKNEAVRKCLDDEEIKRAFGSNRIIKARWVLTWKPTPPDELKEAQEEASNNSSTVLTRDGSKKAKARIVLLGFQHPSLLDPSFKTAAPVQSMIGRNLIYQLSVQNQWELHGLDLATAFLQTQPTEADQEIWTTGVKELRQALGVSDDGVLRILRNVYGSTTAPRGLWLSLHKTLVELGAQPILGERCLWAWFSKDLKDSTNGFPRLLGIMGGHVDDFHCTGDPHSEEWSTIYAKILGAYKWGTAKRSNYRHAGTDLKTIRNSDGTFKIVIDQDAYIETIPDVEIPAERVRQDGPLRPTEVAACRTALGGLQWLAIQTQPQLCARCNLLLTEVVTSGTLATAREIQQMVSEVRQEPFHLEFQKLPGVQHWTDVVFISMGDQAHANRPKGDSTGGLLTLASGPEAITGKVTPMVLLSWRSWKLKRKAIGSNDAEVQSILEAEDQNFRVRMLWSELHGAGSLRSDRRVDLVETAENQAGLLRGVLCTDSRGGYDAVELNESPLLGLSNMRAALQAFQLRDNLKRVGCELRWLASDYDLADGFTKKRAESREGLVKYLRTRLWSIAFDPNFIAAKKNRKTGKTAIQKVDDAIGDFSPPLKSAGAYEDAEFWQHYSMLRAINAGELPEADLQPSPAVLANCCAGCDDLRGPLLKPMT